MTTAPGPRRSTKGTTRLVLLWLVICLSPLSSANALDKDLARAIREAPATAPVLEPFAPGQPKYQVLRLNSVVVSHQGERYSVVKLRVPPGPRQPLVWMFSDIGTIQEYELVRQFDDRPIRGNLRFIYPRLNDPDLAEDSESAQRRLPLPRPWDLFEFHVLGVPEVLLNPGEDYLLWFRFEDSRPADVLLAAVFLKAGTQLSQAALPAIVGLPEVHSQ